MRELISSYTPIAFRAVLDKLDHFPAIIIHEHQQFFILEKIRKTNNQAQQKKKKRKEKKKGKSLYFGSSVLDSFSSVLTISSCLRENETAAYSEYSVSLHSWMKVGRESGSAMATKKSYACLMKKKKRKEKKEISLVKKGKEK
jgi:hypothetical protein